MENLTESIGIVKPNVSSVPMSGYKIVVFKRKRGSKSRPKILDVSDKLIKRGLTALLRKYIAYAVNSHPNLSLERSTEITLPAQYKHFTLRCKVDFRVINPEPLTIWFNEDPIRRIWDEMKSEFVINTMKSDITIKDVKNSFSTIEKKILTKESEERIKEFAVNYGIEVKKIVLHHSLPEDEIKYDIEKAKHDTEMAIDVLNKEKERAKRTSEMHAKEHELEMKRMESAVEAISETYKQLPAAVKQMTDHITGPDTFRESFDALMDSAKKHFGNPRKQLSSNDLYLAANQQNILEVGDAGPFEELQMRLTEIVTEIENLDFDENDKASIRAVANHLKVELECGEKADFDMIDRNLKQLDEYRAKYKEMMPQSFMDGVKEFKAKLREIKPQAEVEKEIEN